MCNVCVDIINHHIKHMMCDHVLVDPRHRLVPYEETTLGNQMICTQRMNSIVCEYNHQQRVWRRENSQRDILGAHVSGTSGSLWTDNLYNYRNLVEHKKRTKKKIYWFCLSIVLTVTTLYQLRDPYFCSPTVVMSTLIFQVRAQVGKKMCLYLFFFSTPFSAVWSWLN